MQPNVMQKIHNMIWLVWACVIVYFFLWNFPNILELLTAQNQLRACLFLYILACALLARFYLTLYRKVDGKILGFLIFLGAFLIRLAALRYSAYVLDNDFAEYYNLGIYFYDGNYSAIQEVTLFYRVSKFGGIAVVYGLLAHIFSPTLLGFQLANCVITSLICLMIYILASIASKKAAFAAAFLYMVYPASISQHK